MYVKATLSVDLEEIILSYRPGRDNSGEGDHTQSQWSLPGREPDSAVNSSCGSRVGMKEKKPGSLVRVGSKT